MFGSVLMIPKAVLPLMAYGIYFHTTHSPLTFLLINSDLLFSFTVTNLVNHAKN